MSSTRRNAASTSAGTTNHKIYTSDEFERWRESHAKIAAIAFKEAGVQVIDFNDPDAIVNENEDCGVSKPAAIARAKAAFETIFANGINLEHHLV